MLFVRSCLVGAGADFDVCFIVMQSIIKCFGNDDMSCIKGESGSVMDCMMEEK